MRQSAVRFLIGLSVCLASLFASSSTVFAVDEFVVPTPDSRPAGITPGPGGLWFTEEQTAANKIGRVTLGGAFNEFGGLTAAPPPGSGQQPETGPAEIVLGPDGNLWFTEIGTGKVGRMGPGGNLLEECAAGGSSSVPDGITVADNQIWFSLSGSNRIGRINPFAANVCGSFSQFPTSSPFPSGPGDITSGHGQLWFTESNGNRVSSMTTSGTYSPGAALPAGGDPSGITTSGAYVWFTDAGNNQIGRIDPTVGSVNLFIPTGAGPSAITTGPDGALWFTETVANKIGRMTIGNSPTLTNEFAIPTANSQPGEIAVGQDNALWFTEFAANKIGRIATAPPFVAPPPPPPVTPAATKKCKVPKLKGLTVKKARTKLKKAGCKYKIRGKGKVRSTSPKAGATTTKTVVVKCKAKKRKAKRAVHRASVVATSLAAPATTHLRQDFADRPEADGLLHRHASKKPRRSNRRLRAPGGRGAYSGLARDGTRAAEAAEATSNTGRRTGKRALMRRLMTVRGGLQA